MMALQTKRAVVSLFISGHSVYASYVRDQLQSRFGFDNPDRIITDAINETLVLVTSIAPLRLTLSPSGEYLLWGVR